jgi:ferredoxin
MRGVRNLARDGEGWALLTGQSHCTPGAIRKHSASHSPVHHRLSSHDESVMTDARSEVPILVSSPEFDRNKKSTTDHTSGQTCPIRGFSQWRPLDPHLVLGPCPSNWTWPSPPRTELFTPTPQTGACPSGSVTNNNENLLEYFPIAAIQNTLHPPQQRFNYLLHATPTHCTVCQHCAFVCPCVCLNIQSLVHGTILTC